MLTKFKLYAAVAAVGVSLLAASTFGAWTWGNHIKLQAAKVTALKDSTIASQVDTIRHKDTVIMARNWQIVGLQTQLDQAKASAAADARLITKTRTMEDVRDRIINNARAQAGLDAPVDPELLLGLRAAWCGLYDETETLPASGAGAGAVPGAAGSAGVGDCAQTPPAQAIVTKADFIQWWTSDQVESIVVDLRREELVQLMKGQPRE
jgi:hypothetical protein